MLRFARALALPLALIFATGTAFAADNWTVKDSTGATVVLRSKDTGTGQAQYHVMSDGSGTAYSSSNPLATILNAGSATIGSIANISGTISLPTGAATAANQATGNTSLATIATNTTGAATAANQTTGNVSLATIATNTTGASTAALQTAGNAKLDTIIGQAAPTSVVGTSLAAGAQAPGFQGITGGVKVGTDTVVQAVATDVGGTIATGGTAQQFMAANTARRGWSLQNQSTGDLYVNCTTTATADYHSLKIPAGALYESSTVHVGTGACSIIGATTAQAFYARQF